MNQNESISTVEKIMTEFAALTGLSPTREDPPQRYLWTDAFAVCNFLGLYHQTGDEKYKQLALDLVEQVHNTLGQHREDDSRSGWISGLEEMEGKGSPTKGGLRIGKGINERKREESFNERLEWHREAGRPSVLEFRSNEVRVYRLTVPCPLKIPSTDHSLAKT